MGFFSGGNLKRLTSDTIKKELVERLKTREIENKVLLLSKEPSPEVSYYKDAIIKRCNEFSIDFIDKEFDREGQDEILSFINSFDKSDGYIILSPFGGDKNLGLLKEEIKLKDLDSFTYQNLALSLEGDIRGLPATARAIAIFIEDKFKDLKRKNITIANRSNIIGKPLAAYLITKGATVSVLNSSTKNPKDFIKNSDIFISAIGKANFYDESYFKDGMCLLDVGTSYVDGKLVGDIDYSSLENLEVEVLTNKKGIGAITTLCLLNGLI